MSLRRGLALVASLGLLALIGMVSFKSSKQESELEIFARREVPSIIQEIEKNEDISFGGAVPNIDSFSEDAFSRAQIRIRRGSYSPARNTISLEKTNGVTPRSDNERGRAVKKTLKHELAHFYVDQRGEELTGQSWPPLDSPPYSHFSSGVDNRLKHISTVRSLGNQAQVQRTEEEFRSFFNAESSPSRSGTTFQRNGRLAEILGYRALSEGLAQCIEGKEGLAEKAKAYRWPANVVDLYLDERYPSALTDAIYLGGFQLVKPLVDEAGFARTTDYIVTHPLKGLKNLEGLKNYAQQALTDLKSK